MDISRGLITKVVDDEALSKVTRSGISQDFIDQDCVSVFNYIQRHYASYKVVPSRDAVSKSFPSFEFVETKEPVEYFIDALKEGFRRTVLEEKIDAISKVYTRDSQVAETLLREALSDLIITQKTFRDVDVRKTASERYKTYQDRAQNPGATGILAGWSKLDYETLGWAAEQFIVLVGEKWMGKSWIMLWLAYQAASQGERVLFVTKEMSQAEIVERFDSIYARVPYGSLRRGELTHAEEQRYEEALSTISSSDYSFTVARQGVQTIEDIEYKAVEVDATIIFSDSVYLFDPDTKGRYAGETNRRMQISQKCKGIAQSLGVPFIVSVQAGRNKKGKEGKPNIDDIEWSNAFSQDADVVIYLHKDEVDKELHRAQIHLLKCRGGSEQIELFIDQDFEWMQFTERNDRPNPTTEVFTEDDEGISLSPVR